MDLKKLVQRNYLHIKENLESGEVSDYLYQEDVLTMIEHDRVKAEHRPDERREILLKLLEKKGDDVYEHFFTALEKRQPSLRTRLLQGRGEDVQTGGGRQERPKSSRYAKKMTCEVCGHRLSSSEMLTTSMESQFSVRSIGTSHTEDVARMRDRIRTLEKNLSTEESRARMLQSKYEDLKIEKEREIKDFKQREVKNKAEVSLTKAIREKCQLQDIVAGLESKCKGMEKDRQVEKDSRKAEIDKIRKVSEAQLEEMRVQLTKTGDSTLATLDLPHPPSAEEPVYAVGRSSLPVFCPAMKLDTDRVGPGCHISEDGELEAQLDQHHIGGFKIYCGSCSHFPFALPAYPSIFTTPRYWESHTRVRVESGGWCNLLEMGVCQEGEVDTDYWVSRQPRSSWTVLVTKACPPHSQGVCTQVRAERRQVGECRTNTISNTPGTTAEFRYGVVLDVGSGSLGFIDLNREIVLHKFDVQFTEPLRPMFTVWPGLDHYTVKMRLVSGGEITMSDTKKALISQVLTTS